MGQGDHRNHREAAVSSRPNIISDRSSTGGEFHHYAEVKVEDGEIVVRGQLLVDSVVVNEVRHQLPEGTRPLPPSDLGRDRIRRLLDWAAGEGDPDPGDGGGGYGGDGGQGRGGYGQGGGGGDGDGDVEGDDDNDVPFARFELPPGEDLVCVVRRLRQRFGSYVGPNHALFGEQSYHGSPVTPPAPAAPGWQSGPARGPSVGRVGIIDTGFADFSGTSEADRLSGVDRAPSSLDVPDADPADGKLDWEAGHGTFIAGQIRHALPDGDIVVVKGLDGLGSVSEADLCHLMIIAGQRGVDVLNLSLGGYALDDECPSGLAATIAHLEYQRDLVIVAAAGNKGSDRPFWPAASRHVVAVGALNEAGGWPAWFTNFGPWVDACAPAVDLVSWFFEFKGGLDAVPVSVVEDFDSWACWSGTSFAAPQFSAAVCALRAKLAEEGISIGFRDASLRLLARGARSVSGLGTEFDVDIAALPWP
jgi:hypothetical protein